MTDTDSPSSPLTPNTKAHLEVIAYNQYVRAKEQIHQLEQELNEFQESSKELELELEQELAESEERQEKLEDRISSLESEVAEWKKKALDAHKEAAATQQALQKEVSSLRDAHKLVKERLRETENANDDIEQRERITCSTLEDIQTRYNEALENVAILEAEMAARDFLAGDNHRAKEEIRDLTEELAHTRSKLETRDRELEEANKRIMSQPPPRSTGNAVHRRAVSGTAQVSAEGYLTPLVVSGDKPMSSSRSMQFIHGLQSQMRSLESRVAHVKSSLPKPVTPKRAKSSSATLPSSGTLRQTPSMALLSRKLGESDLEIVSLSPSRSTSSLEELCTPSPSPQLCRRLNAQNGSSTRGEKTLYTRPDTRGDPRSSTRGAVRNGKPRVSSTATITTTVAPLDPIEGSPNSAETRKKRSISPVKKLSSLTLNAPSLPSSHARVNIPALMRPPSPVKNVSPPKPTVGAKFADVYGRKR